jgi:hypothetical protein
MLRQADTYLIRILLTYAILLVGIFFLNWHVFEILFLFYAEIFFIGFFSLLRILTAWGGKIGKDGWLSKIVRNVFLTWFYSAFVGMFLVFIMVFTLMEYEQTWDSADYSILSLGFMIMGINYGIDFLFIYLGENQYLTADPLAEMWKSVFRLFPVVVIIAVVVAPNAKRLPGVDANTGMILGILLVKVIVDIIQYKFSHIKLFEDAKDESGERPN